MNDNGYVMPEGAGGNWPPSDPGHKKDEGSKKKVAILVVAFLAAIGITFAVAVAVTGGDDTSSKPTSTPSATKSSTQQPYTPPAPAVDPDQECITFFQEEVSPVVEESRDLLAEAESEFTGDVDTIMASASTYVSKWDSIASRHAEQRYEAAAACDGASFSYDITESLRYLELSALDWSLSWSAIESGDIEEALEYGKEANADSDRALVHIKNVSEIVGV